MIGQGNVYITYMGLTPVLLDFEWTASALKCAGDHICLLANFDLSVALVTMVTKSIHDWPGKVQITYIVANSDVIGLWVNCESPDRSLRSDLSTHPIWLTSNLGNQGNKVNSWFARCNVKITYMRLTPVLLACMWTVSPLTGPWDLICLHTQFDLHATLVTKVTK